MYDYDSLESILGGAVIFLVILVLILLAYAIFLIVCQWKLFKKAGKNGWEAIVPFYSTWVLVEIAGLNWWYFLIAISGTVASILGLTKISWITWLTNIASIAVNFFIFYNIAKKMHKEPMGFAIGGALVSWIMIPILALSKKYVYDASVAVSPNGPIGDNKENNNNNTAAEPERFCLGCGQKLKPGQAFCENCGKKVE